MRENIGLFHGKRKDNGEWVCGDLVHSWEKMNAKPDIQIHNNMGYFDVIPETVGEYTGLTDKNGKRIFEGDILQSSYHPIKLIVAFKDGIFHLIGTSVALKYANQLEVIGNIHDNPRTVERS